MLQLFDTHTHFDVSDFDHDRLALSQAASLMHVKGLVLIGFVAQRFEVLAHVATQLTEWRQSGFHVPDCYLAPGLHPYYIEVHQPIDLQYLDAFLRQHRCVAIGEIGLDRFETRHKGVEVQEKQMTYFSAQLDLAQQHHLPVMLHIRKAHSETLAILKRHRFKNGGIAHAFSGGVEEAKAFVRQGFKIGITGQITNANAKRLRHVVSALSIHDLVIETDCPDMTPQCCQQPNEVSTRNTPAYLIYVLEGLANYLAIDALQLAQQLWHNTSQILDLDRRVEVTHLASKDGLEL